VELVPDSTLALDTALATLDLKIPFMANLDETDGSTATSRFESRDFLLAHSFKTTSDPIANALNSSSSGSPISLHLDFASNPNTSGNEKTVLTFIQQTNTLYIKPNGESSMIAN
jgi:hypothetical protein